MSYDFHLKDKYLKLENRVKGFWERFNSNAKKNKLAKKTSTEAAWPDTHELGDESFIGTAPRTKTPIQSGVPPKAQEMVWDNEDASMQDKSYLFDEDTTDANYDFEDDFEFEEKRESETRRDSRYD